MHRIVANETSSDISRDKSLEARSRSYSSYSKSQYDTTWSIAKTSLSDEAHSTMSSIDTVSSGQPILETSSTQAISETTSTQAKSETSTTQAISETSTNQAISETSTTQGTHTSSSPRVDVSTTGELVSEKQSSTSMIRAISTTQQSLSSIKGLSKTIITSTMANNGQTVTVTKWMDATGRIYPTSAIGRSSGDSHIDVHTKLAIGLAVPLGTIALALLCALLFISKRKRRRASMEHAFSPDKEAELHHHNREMSFVPRISLDSDPSFYDSYVSRINQQHHDTDSIVDCTYPVVDPVLARNSVFSTK